MWWGVDNILALSFISFYFRPCERGGNGISRPWIDGWVRLLGSVDGWLNFDRG